MDESKIYYVKIKKPSKTNYKNKDGSGKSSLTYSVRIPKKVLDIMGINEGEKLRLSYSLDKDKPIIILFRKPFSSIEFLRKIKDNEELFKKRGGIKSSKETKLNNAINEVKEEIKYFRNINKSVPAYKGKDKRKIKYYKNFQKYNLDRIREDYELIKTYKNDLNNIRSKASS